MGIENAIIPLIIYAAGAMLILYLAYRDIVKEKDITLGDLLPMIFLSSFSWFGILFFIICYICDNKDKVIVKKKETKKKEQFEENIPLLEEHKTSEDYAPKEGIMNKIKRQRL